MKPKVSIIVAAYNVEAYIRRCIESLINQTLQEIEIIIVNDGSTDNTENIVRELERKDRRIKVLTQENAGLSAARNTGIKSASANYIAFLDGDDYVHNEMYEKLYNSITQHNADMAVCGFYKVYQDNNSFEINREEYSINKKLLDGDLIANFLAKHDEPFVVVWNKLYDLNIIKHNQIFFENRAFFEDVGFIPRYLYYSRKVVLVDEPLHYYVQREGSITKKYNEVIEESAGKTLKLLESFFYTKNILEKYRDYLNSLEIRILIYIINMKIRHKKNIDKELNRLKSLKVTKLPLIHRIGFCLIKYFSNLYTRLFNIKEFLGN